MEVGKSAKDAVGGEVATTSSQARCGRAAGRVGRAVGALFCGRLSMSCSIMLPKLRLCGSTARPSGAEECLALGWDGEDAIWSPKDGRKEGQEEALGATGGVGATTRGVGTAIA